MSEAEATSSSSDEHEFSTAHNQILTGLSGAVVLVSVATILLSSINIMFGLAQAQVPGHGLSASFLSLSGIAGLAIGFWLMNAASAIDQVVKTKGHDITHLMKGLADLRRVFRWQALLIGVQATLILFVTIIALR